MSISEGFSHVVKALIGKIDVLLYGEDPTFDVMKVHQAYPSHAVIKTATTTIVKATPGRIGEIRCAGGTLGAVTIYNGPAAGADEMFPATTPVQGQLLLANVDFSTDLTIVTAAATYLTISYA